MTALGTITRHARMALMRKALASPMACRRLNRRYNHMTAPEKETFYHRYAKACREHSVRFGEKEWFVIWEFGGIRVPLRHLYGWLDWDLALSILGHDAEIVDFYARILRSEFRPDVFVDIGANYGAHTALFAAAGVQCVAFEPNVHCGDYIRMLMNLNRLDAYYRLEPTALGDATGNAQLEFPPMEAWLGTIKEAARLIADDVVTETVPVCRLDDIADRISPCSAGTMQRPKGRCLAKIDTEGSELSIIRGGREFLRERCDFFVFEAGAESRAFGVLYDEIVGLGFTIEKLPLDCFLAEKPLSREAFGDAPGWNFLARRVSKP